MTRVGLADTFRKLAVVFALSLPFLVPYGGPGRNTDMQGLVLLLAGACGWAVIALERFAALRALDKPVRVLLFVFALSCLGSLLSPHFAYNVLGAPHVRLGIAGLFACIGCGLALRSVELKRFMTWLYGTLCVLAGVALPYAWIRFHDLARLGGTFAQADIFAVMLGCGLMLGIWMLREYPGKRPYLLAGQILLAVLLVASGTRAVIILMLLLLPLCAKVRWRSWGWVIYGSLCVALLLAAQAAAPSRVTDVRYANESLRYRLDLQGASLQASWKRPVAGYGIGNLADALDCSRLQKPRLKATCRKHYFFNSSHNIFLDRTLALGWIGGLSYFALFAYAIWRGLRAKDRSKHVLAFCLLLIGLYYWTNVTSVSLELLAWVLLLRIADSSRASASR